MKKSQILLLLGVAVLQLLIFSTNSAGQMLYDGGREDRAGNYMLYQQASSLYHLVSFEHDPPPYVNPAITFEHLEFDRNLLFQSSSKISLPVPSGFQYNDYQRLRSANNRLLMARINASKPSAPPFSKFKFLTHWEFCRYRNDSVKDCMQLTPDSAYGTRLLSHWFLPRNDTLYAIARLSLGANDTNSREYFIKLDTLSGNVSQRELNLSYSGGKVYFGSSPIVHPNGNLMMVGSIDQRQPRQLYTVLLEVDKNLTTVYKSQGITSPLSNLYKLWRIGNKAVVFSRSIFDNPNLQPNYSFAMSFEVFDLVNDSLIAEYKYQLSKPSNDYDAHETAGPGVYFDGKYFILSGTIKDSSVNYQSYRSVIFAVDTNFRLLNHISFGDSSRYNLSFVSAIIPEPDSAHNFIYAGSIQGAVINNAQFDVTWGRFKVKDPYVSLPEINWRRTEVYFYPNPSSTHVNVLIDSDKLKPYQLEFYNQKGQKVLEAETDGLKTRVAHNLAAGVYTVVASNGVNREVLSLVVK